MKYMISLVRELVDKRRLLWELSKADFKKRFVGSYFGVIWMFIQPVVTVLIYWLIFGPIGFKSAPPVPNASYVQWLVPGIAPWFFFSEALNVGTGCLQEYNYLVKKVVFRVEILPVIKLLSCLFVHLFFVAIMFVVFLVSGRLPMASWLQLIYYAFAASMLALALSYLTSAIQVFFKDMAQIVGICLQFGMWLTPIMYSEQLFVDKGITIAPFVLKLNPFYYIAAGYRDSMLTGDPFFMRPMLTVYFWAVTAFLMAVGLKVFKRLRPHFADVL
ncbi:MAG: ABC transporter permease [Lachnospiraceae bacterium]|nr:ABC transporter permease [Lachnospiraceae bacterium]